MASKRSIRPFWVTARSRQTIRLAMHLWWCGFAEDEDDFLPIGHPTC